MKPNSIFPTRRENYTISTAKTGFRLRSGLPWCPPIDDEPDYLFGLIVNETLEGAYNQYKSPRLMWGAILKHGDRIKSERPDLHTKSVSRSGATLSDML